MDAIPVGLVGYGFGGSVFHAPLVRAEPRLRLRYVVTSRVEQIRRIPGAEPVATVAEVLAKPEVRLVIVTSPSGTHYEITRAALEAGKDVVVDKPFALRAAEADELMALAARRKRMLTVFQSRRWDGDFLTVRDLIGRGVLGTVSYYEARYDRFRLGVRQMWKEQPVAGSGILYDLGSHLIDQALVLFGMPQAVTADVFPQRNGAQAIDYFHLTLFYGRLRAILHSAMIVPYPGPHFTIHGDGGSFLKYGMDTQEATLKDGGMPGDPGFGHDDPSHYGELHLADGTCRKVETIHGGYAEYYRLVAEAMEDGAPPPVDPADSRDGLKVIEAAARSAAAKQTIELG